MEIEALKHTSPKDLHVDHKIMDEGESSDLMLRVYVFEVTRGRIRFVIIIQKHVESHHRFAEMSKCHTIGDRIIPFREAVNEIVMTVLPDVE